MGIAANRENLMPANPINPNTRRNGFQSHRNRQRNLKETHKLKKLINIVTSRRRRSPILNIVSPMLTKMKLLLVINRTNHTEEEVEAEEEATTIKVTEVAEEEEVAAITRNQKDPPPRNRNIS